MENLPPPYPIRKNGWILPFKDKILMLRSKGYPFYQIAEILQPEAQKQGRKVSASIVSYWVTTWRRQEKKAEAKNPTPTPQLGEYGYNPFFADWLIGECQNLHRFGDFDENGVYFMCILFGLMTCWTLTETTPKLREMVGIFGKYPPF